MMFWCSQSPQPPPPPSIIVLPCWEGDSREVTEVVLQVISCLAATRKYYSSSVQHSKYCTALHWCRTFLQVGFASQGNYTAGCEKLLRECEMWVVLFCLTVLLTLPVPESSSNEAYLAHISCQVSSKPSGQWEGRRERGGREGGGR